MFMLLTRQFIDIFGIAPINQLSNWLMQEAQNKSKSYYVIFADERAFLVAMNGDQSVMIVDSHRHGSKGAIIACCQRGHVGSFALWFDAMMNATWVVSLTIASISQYFKKKVLVSSTQQRILLTLLFVRPVSCDYYTLRQGLNKIV